MPKFKEKDYRISIRIDEYTYKQIEILKDYIIHNHFSYGYETTTTDVIYKAINLMFDIIIRKNNEIKLLLKENNKIDLCIIQKSAENRKTN